MRHQRRVFLNDASGLAAVMAEIEEPEKHGMSASFDLSDCNRVVSIDFYASQDTTTAMRSKVNRLYREIKAFRAAYLNALDDMESMA